MRDGEGYLLADGGGNAVVRASHKGTFTTVTALPPGSALAPPFLGLPPGTQIPTDSVPTSVVQGPDGAFYISQLTGFPFALAQQSRVWLASAYVSTSAVCVGDGEVIRIPLG